MAIGNNSHYHCISNELRIVAGFIVMISLHYTLGFLNSHIHWIDTILASLESHFWLQYHNRYTLASLILPTLLRYWYWLLQYHSLEYTLSLMSLIRQYWLIDGHIDFLPQLRHITVILDTYDITLSFSPAANMLSLLFSLIAIDNSFHVDYH